MARQSWIARRKITPPAEERKPEMKGKPWVISIKGVTRNCDYAMTDFSGLIIVDIQSGGWPADMNVQDKYTLTHVQSGEKICVFESYDHFCEFMDDKKVQELFRRIKWFKSGVEVVQAMQPHLGTLRELQRLHNCWPER